MQKNGILFVFLGPSGSGKTTLAKYIFKKLNSKIFFLPTYTTREMRIGELNGLDYKFISKSEFQSLIKINYFMEYVIIDENLYGTPRDYLNRLNNGENILLILNKDGYIFWKERFNNIKSFYIDAEEKELENRLLKRSYGDLNFINSRLENDKNQFNIQRNDLDFFINNLDLEFTKKFILKEIKKTMKVL